MEFEAVIGLEVHAELNTKTKMYCRCENAFGGEPNTRVCPVCTGMPGVLPSLNREAVVKAIAAGRMMNCEIATEIRQSRKHYRYPDLPKGFQLSQFDSPLCTNGSFDYFCGETLCTAKIKQIHIEEDAGKLIHEGENTFVDYNRCGVPLIEIVTEPCFNSSDEAVSFMEAVRVMLLDIGISDCRMEEGSLRADVNVSLRKKGENVLNPRVEMKNLATFSGARRAIDYEIDRQMKILSSGDKVTPLTRRWDDEKRVGITMRDKESASDYRFMPEPDIPCVKLPEIKLDLPESEAMRRSRLLKLLRFSQASELSLDMRITDFFDKTVECGADAKTTANWLLGYVSQLCNEYELAVYNSKLTADALCETLKLIENKKITGDGAKKVVHELFVNGGNVAEIVKKFNLEVVVDNKLYDEIVSAVISENPKAIADYKAGKGNAIGFFIGQCMRRAGAGGDASLFKNKILEELGRL